MVSGSPNPPAPPEDDPALVAVTPAAETEADIRKRSQAIAFGAGAFLALGLGLPIGFALRDWKIGLIVGLAVGVLTIIGYLKAGADHAERRAARIAREHTLSDEEMDDEEEDNGAYR